LWRERYIQEKIIIIAGPNGAGKTTFAEEFLPKEAACPAFINADLIAAGLAPFRPETAAFRAGRLMMEEVFNHARRGENPAFETTLSDRIYAGLIPGWQTNGYAVKLFFSSISFPRAGNRPSPATGSRRRSQHSGTGDPAAFHGRVAEFLQSLQTHRGRMGAL